MYGVDLYRRVRLACHREGLSRREASRQFGIDRKTVAKILLHSEPPGYRRRQPPKRPKLAPFTDIIDGILEEDRTVHRKQRHTAKRIFERLRDEHGFTGKQTIVKDYVRERHLGLREMFVPLAHPPGHAQADFGEADAIIAGVMHRAHFFVMTLPHSDACFVAAYPAATAEAWLDGHNAAFAFFGGVPQSILYDNDKAGSTGRRNTFSLTGLQALVQSFGGSSPSEGLAGPCIERVSNNCEYVRTVCAQIGSFREVLSKQSIGVLVRSALPRAVRFAEVDGKAGCDPQIRMPGHLCSLVPGQRAAKLRWQCRDRPGDGIANRFSPMTGKRRPVLHARDGAVAFHSGKMQQHCEPRGAFHQSADRRSAQADDQVTFPVSGYGPISCFRRSFTDHDLRRDEGFAPPAATCPRHAQCPSRANATCSVQTDPTAVCVPS